MSKGPLRMLIPISFSDLDKWPRIDVNALSEEKKVEYLKRCTAVRMYADQIPFAEIRRETGIVAVEVRRFVKRCVTDDGQGGIFGFAALTGSKRLEGYVRAREVIAHEPNQRGGFSGAFMRLLRMHPEIDDYIKERLLKLPSEAEIHEARVSYVDLHRAVLKKLRKLGVSEREYPFNTRHYGYTSFVDYCKSIRDTYWQRWVGARLGKEAASRKHVGTGHQSILPRLRAYSSVQLDYQKIDAASIITIETPYGELHVEVPRFYIGLLIEEKNRMILGIYASLETNPSSDCALETIYHALAPEEYQEGDPKIALAGDGKIVINQLIGELAYQCFSVLKVDNAWCNSATEVANNIIDTVGCAMNFGPAHSWVRRELVEKIIGELTKHGVQRLQSTHGSGVGDDRVDDPSNKAIKYRIRLSDLTSILYGCVKEWNTTRSEGVFFSSPLSAMQNDIAKPASGFFVQPLPKSAQQDPKLLTHVEECVVRGNQKKNISPYFQTDRCRYQNVELARSFHLIGKTVVAYISRRDSRNVTATVKESGQEIGVVFPERRWSYHPCSWRLRKIINRWGLGLKRRELSNDVVQEFHKNKFNELRNRPKGKGKKAEGATLETAKNVMHRQGDHSETPSDKDLVKSHRSPLDPFSDW